MFDAKKITDSFNEVLNNPTYKQNMLRLQTIQKTTGGAALAVSTVEKEFITNGNTHLRDDISLQKYKKMNWLAGCCCDCFQFILTAVLIYFTVEYFLLTEDHIQMKKL